MWLRGADHAHTPLSLTPLPAWPIPPPFAGPLRDHILVQETITAQANVPVRLSQPSSPQETLNPAQVSRGLSVN